MSDDEDELTLNDMRFEVSSFLRRGFKLSQACEIVGLDPRHYCKPTSRRPAGFLPSPSEIRKSCAEALSQRTEESDARLHDRIERLLELFRKYPRMSIKRASEMGKMPALAAKECLETLVVAGICVMDNEIVATYSIESQDVTSDGLESADSILERFRDHSSH